MMRGRMMRRRRRIRSREDERRMMETAWRVKEGWIERWMNMMMTRRIGRRRRRSLDAEVLGYIFEVSLSIYGLS